jgi:hypothetical protein
MACISASQSSLNTVLSMYKSLRLITDFRPHLRVILDQCIIPKIDFLEGKDLFMVLEGMNALKIGNQVWFDLLATEFSRKVD